MLTLTSAAAITAVALIVPLVIHTLRVPIPEISGQIVVGVIVGPQALWWVRVDPPAQVL